MIKGAEISDCLKYRYTLTRIWDAYKEQVVIIGLNPSTADAYKDDATIRKEIALVSRHGYGGFVKLNLFARRATNPNDLLDGENPTTLHNKYVLDKYKDNTSILAWGSHLIFSDWLEFLRYVIEGYSGAYCFGYNKDGNPKQ